MQRCTISVIDGDGEPHQVAVNAASLFDAVDQAIEQWSRLWWFNSSAVAEVQVGNRRWRVRLQRVISWRGGKGAVMPSEGQNTRRGVNTRTRKNAKSPDSGPGAPVSWAATQTLLGKYLSLHA